MGGWTGLALKAASGAMAGDEERRAREAADAERQQARKSSDLFTRLRLLTTPGVHVGEQAPGGEPLPEQPAGMPTSMRAVTKQPKSLIQAGSIALDGVDTPIGFDPDFTADAVAHRERTEADEKLARAKGEKDNANKSAFQFLHGEDADAYPDFVEGYDYGSEVKSFLDDRRSAENDKLARTDREGLAGAERARKDTLDQARTRAFNFFVDGRSMPDVFKVMQEGKYKDVLSPDDLIALMREAGQTTRGADQQSAMKDRLAALEEAGVPEPRRSAIARDAVLFRQWDKEQNGGGDDVMSLLEEPEAPAAPKKPGMFSGISGMFGDEPDGDDQGGPSDGDGDDVPDDVLMDLITKHPDASPEEIAAMARGVR